MKAKSTTPSRAPRKRSAKSKKSAIPEPLRFVSSATVRAGNKEIKVPTLTLRGLWLKAAGFPPGAACYVILDRLGEMAVARLGLGVPRRLRIVVK